MQPGGNEDDNYTDNEASISMFLGKIHSAFADTIIPELYSNKEDDDGNNDSNHSNISISIRTNPKPLIILLNVSGGCDSVALFHTMRINILKSAASAIHTAYWE